MYGHLPRNRIPVNTYKRSRAGGETEGAESNENPCSSEMKTLLVISLRH